VLTRRNIRLLLEGIDIALRRRGHSSIEGLKVGKKR
jgi:hypothetical protein